MTLKQLVDNAQSSQKKKNGNSITKGPAFYNKQRQFFIVSLVNNDNPIVRQAAVESEFIPTKVLQNAFSEETNEGVIRSIMMQPKLPVTSLIAFASDPKCEYLGDDTEMCAHLKARITKES